MTGKVMNENVMNCDNLWIFENIHNGLPRGSIDTYNVALIIFTKEIFWELDCHWAILFYWILLVTLVLTATMKKSSSSMILVALLAFVEASSQDRDLRNTSHGKVDAMINNS